MADQRDHKVQLNLNLTLAPPELPSLHDSAASTGDRTRRSSSRLRAMFLGSAMPRSTISNPRPTYTGSSSAPANEVDVDRLSFFDCNICFEMATEPVVSSCGHLFCWPCLARWLPAAAGVPGECPICKGIIVVTTITPIYGRGYDSNNPSVVHRGIPPRPRARRMENWQQSLAANQYVLLHAALSSSAVRREATNNHNSLQAEQPPAARESGPRRQSGTVLLLDRLMEDQIALLHMQWHRARLEAELARIVLPTQAVSLVERAERFGPSFVWPLAARAAYSQQTSATPGVAASSATRPSRQGTPQISGPPQKKTRGD